MGRVEDGWHERHQVSGFGSGEAFIQHAAERPGEAILMIEPELSRLFAVAAREGSTASAALRSAWDFRRMELRTRSHLLDAPAAPVSLVGHITMGELRDTRHGLRGVEILNGFGNRVLWTYVDRRKSVSSPRPLRGTEITPLVWRLRLALESARRSGEVMRSPEAELLWKGLYGEIVDDAAEGIVDAVVARGEAQLLRLSLIYALLDGSATIGPRHLESAWEVWRYCRWSAQHIWVGDGTGDPDLDRIADLLSAGDELSASQLDRMFHGHRSIPELRAKAISTGIAMEYTRDTGGRPARMLRAAEKAEKGPSSRWWVYPRFRDKAFSSSSAT